MDQVILFLSNHWQEITIGVLIADKVVALTPTPWDDLIWTASKKLIGLVIKKK